MGEKILEMPEIIEIEESPKMEETSSEKDDEENTETSSEEKILLGRGFFYLRRVFCFYDFWYFYDFCGGRKLVRGGGQRVTKRIDTNAYEWSSWKWRTSKDVFKNGAYFIPSGYGTITPLYGRAEWFPVAHGSQVPSLTSSAGPLRCYAGSYC